MLRFYVIRARIQALQAERELPQDDRREHAIIDGDIQHANNDLNAQQALQDATTSSSTSMQENSSATSSCMLPNQVAIRTTYFDDFIQPTSDGKCFDNSDINMLQELVYSTTVHLTTGHSTSSTSMDRDITTTAVSKMDTRHLSIRDDTSCHRRCVEGEYSNKQLTWTDTTTSVASGTTTSYLARSTSNNRQLLCQQLHAPSWSDHQEHRPGHQHRAAERQRQKGKRKKKGKGKGYNKNYYNNNYNHYNTYHNQSQQPQKGKSKGKGPIGSFDNITGKGKHVKGDKNNKGKGKSTFVYLGIEMLGLWQAWTSSCLMLVQRPEEHQQYHLNNSSFSFRAHQISPSPTCFQKASLRSTSSRYLSSNNNLNFSVSRYDKHYLLHQLRL